MSTQAVIESETLKTKRADLLNIDPRNIIVESDFNSRTDFGDIEGLMHSILNNTQIEPITVTKVRGEEKYILTDGERRLRAIRLAIEKGYEVPFIKAVIGSANLEDRIFAMVVTGTDKKPLNLLEQAEAYKKLVGLGYKVKEIATRVGKSEVNIYGLLNLAEAPKRVKNAIIDEEISTNTVMQLMKKVKTADDLLRVVEEAVNASKQSGTGTAKKATAKNVEKLLTPMQKLKAGFTIAETKGYANLELYASLVTALTAADSTPEKIAKLFK